MYGCNGDGFPHLKLPDRWFTLAGLLVRILEAHRAVIQETPLVQILLERLVLCTLHLYFLSPCTIGSPFPYHTTALLLSYGWLLLLHISRVQGAAYDL